jgi:hypothetical protein
MSRFPVCGERMLGALRTTGIFWEDSRLLDVCVALTRIPDNYGRLVSTHLPSWSLLEYHSITAIHQVTGILGLEHFSISLVTIVNV